MRQATDLLLFGILLFHKSFYKEAAAQVCGTVPAVCGPDTDEYRTFSGECNNKIYTWYGSIFSAYDNLTSNNDGFGPQNMPRAISGNRLPNARRVRSRCLPDDTMLQLELGISRYSTGYLQFMAHDMSSAFFANDNFFTCCTPDFKLLPNAPAYCRSITLPANDPLTLECGINCMPMVRTLTNVDRGCDLTSPYTKKITRSTACLDLNIIYGNSKTESDDLRIAGTALLKTENYLNFPFPPQTRDDAEREMFCSIYDVSTCFRGGDIRMNQNPDLTIHHILWIRFHNIVAKILEKLNPCWNYEKVFQEARKINIAVHQWFVYNDLLPQVLGRANMYENRLLFESYFYLYVDDYDPYCSPNVLNEFAMVGLRILHPFITGQLGFFNEQRQPTGSIPLSDCLLKPQITKEKFQPLLTGSLTERAHKMCPDYDPVVTNRMFQRSLKCGLDLIAIDIQRNRDHLVPTYNNLRVHCGLPRANSFDDLHDVMDPLSIERLIESYVSVEDVDAYVGCQLERPVSGAKVGPTANCILTEQFKRGRRCDRFFLEHSNVFTNYQLKEIRSFTVAAFICLTSNYMDTMQADPFAPPYGFNTPIPCAFFYKINWNYWIDPKCFFSGL